VKDVFGAALDVEEPARTAWVAERCAGDAELRAEVESLLAAHTRPQGVLDKPAAAYLSDGAFAEAADRWIGRRLGPWEITALLGSGGMGEVYRARRVDAEYDKEVAIKLVPGGYQAAFVLQRMRAERQILADLDHPNIARLIDGGATEKGFPYLVMELVDGVPVDRYCEARPLAEKLRLFREVCGAVSYAHARLVVHRDLKPGNILVTADGAVKLLDFGIAKLLQGGDAPADVTIMQTFTPGFASPEQVLGKPITTASDVYSLGVLLYLLISGRSPYRGRMDTTQDAIREVCESEPAPPGVSRDLDAICLRALRKEPDKRYRSVEELSEDIRRHQSGLPVIARGDRFSYRAGKFLRRHRIEVAAAGIVAATLIGGVVVALREARVAETERARAERHFQSVRSLADTFMFKVHDAIAPLPGSTEARGLLVDTGMQYLNTLAAEAGDDRELQLDLANAYAKLADIQGQAYAANTGKKRVALTSYSRSIELAEHLVAADAKNLPAQRALANALLERNRLLLLFGEPAKALIDARSAVTKFEALAKSQPEQDGALRDLSRAYSVASLTFDYSGLAQESRDSVLKSVSLMETLVARAPRDRSLRRQLGGAYSTAAVTFLDERKNPDDIAAAIALHEKSLRIDEELVAEGGDDSDSVQSLLADHANLNNLLNFKGDYAAAIAHCEQSRRLLSQLRADTKNAEMDIRGSLVQLHCARSARGLSRYAEVQELTSEIMAVLTRLSKTSDDLYVQYGLGVGNELLGSLAARAQDWRRARDSYQSALDHFGVVSAKVSLDALDLASVVDARAGLARANAELGALTATSSLAR